jgi:hypothetical protein
MSSALVIVTTVSVEAGIVRNTSGLLFLGVWPPGTEPCGLTRLQGDRPARIDGPGWTPTGGAAWTVVGGVLPAAARAVALTTRDSTRHDGVVSAGAWVIVATGDIGIPLGLPPLRYSDDDGKLISALAPGYDPKPIAPDLVAQLAPCECCPVCETSAWSLVSSWCGRREHVVCSACGYTDGAVTGLYGRAGEA